MSGSARALTLPLGSITLGESGGAPSDPNVTIYSTSRPRQAVFQAERSTILLRFRGRYFSCIAGYVSRISYASQAWIDASVPAICLLTKVFSMHAPTRALIHSGECVDGCANDEGGGCLVGMRFVCDLVLCRRLNSFVGELAYIHTRMRAYMHAHTYVRISIISATGASTCKTLSCVAPVATAQMKRSNISATAAGNGDSNPCQYPHKNTRAHAPHPHNFHA